VSRSYALAGASAHLSHNDEVALEHYGQAHAAAQSETDVRQALWGQFVAHADLERDAASALEELEAHSTDAVDDLLRLGNGRLLLSTLTGSGCREALEAVRRLAPLVDRVRDPLIHTSFLNAYASILVLSGEYTMALSVAENEMRQASDYKLDFVLSHAGVCRAAALWGLRRFRHCATSLDQLQRQINPEDGLVLMNIGAIRAKLQLSLGSPGKALASLLQYDNEHAPVGMEAEYKAWWSLALACANERTEALRVAREAEGMTGRAEVTALVPWTRATVASIEGKRTARALAQRALETSLEMGNVDAFVAAYRAHPEHLRAIATKGNERDLRRILRGAMDPALGRKVGLSVRGPEPTAVRDSLSPREREILALVVQGSTNKEMAKALFITETTVKVHLRHIYKKLGVRSRTEAAIRALEDDT
jgi:DNA-binding CsgD family transcriptional regulator